MIDSRSGPRIGVLVPYTNCNLEPDLALMRPEGSTFHFERMGGYDIDEIPDAGQMAGLGGSDIAEALRLIAGARPAAILYGCTSATLTHGPAFDRDLAEKIRAATGGVSITAAGAIVTALGILGVSRVGFASPYVGEINDQAIAFLADEGIDTATRVDIGKDLGNYGQGELSPDEVFALATRAASPEVEALVLSCTDMRSVEVIDALEQATGLPVVASNQAMVFALCRALGLTRPAGAFGCLFDAL